MQIAIATKLNKAEPLLNLKLNLTFLFGFPTKDSLALLILRGGGWQKVRCSIGVVWVAGSPFHC